MTEIRNTLLQIERETGIKPALLYVSFIPSKPEAGKDDSDQLQLVMVTGVGNPILRRGGDERENQPSGGGISPRSGI